MATLYNESHPNGLKLSEQEYLDYRLRMIAAGIANCEYVSDICAYADFPLSENNKLFLANRLPFVLREMRKDELNQHTIN